MYNITDTHTLTLIDLSLSSLNSLSLLVIRITNITSCGVPLLSGFLFHQLNIILILLIYLP